MSGATTSGDIAKKPTRFLVVIRTAAGGRREYTRIGGDSCLHVIDASYGVVLGDRISARPIPQGAAHA